MTFITTHLPAPVLRTTDHVVASLPFLLGFQPKCSAVLLWLRDGVLILTQRVDLPQIPNQCIDSTLLNYWATSTIELASHTPSHEVLIAVFPPAPKTTPALGVKLTQEWEANESASLLVALSRALVSAGMYLGDAWLVIEDDFWNFDFQTDRFSDMRHTVDPQVIVEVNDDFVNAGWSHLADRQEVLDEFDTDPKEQHLMLNVIRQQKNRADPGEQEIRCDTRIITIVASLNADATDQLAQAQMITGLADIGVRDCVLWQLTNDGALARCAENFHRALRATPAGFRAPLATMTALAYWVQGDGVRAGAAVKQALLDDADYGLAQLVDIALTNGIPPRMWQETIQQMPYEACRAGIARHVQ